jgi:GAF domain-containing protein
VFALEPEDLDGDGAYIGVELIDRGNSVGGATVYEGRAPRFWRAEDL